MGHGMGMLLMLLLSGVLWSIVAYLAKDDPPVAVYHPKVEKFAAVMIVVWIVAAIVGGAG